MIVIYRKELSHLGWLFVGLANEGAELVVIGVLLVTLLHSSMVKRLILFTFNSLTCAFTAHMIRLPQSILILCSKELRILQFTQ